LKSNLSISSQRGRGISLPTIAPFVEMAFKITALNVKALMRLIKKIVV
jgi:hypothetical protein